MFASPLFTLYLNNWWSSSQIWMRANKIFLVSGLSWLRRWHNKCWICNFIVSANKKKRQTRMRSFVLVADLSSTFNVWRTFLSISCFSHLWWNPLKKSHFIYQFLCPFGGEIAVEVSLKSAWVLTIAAWIYILIYCHILWFLWIWFLWRGDWRRDVRLVWTF